MVLSWAVARMAFSDPREFDQESQQDHDNGRGDQNDDLRRTDDVGNRLDKFKIGNQGRKRQKIRGLGQEHIVSAKKATPRWH